MFFAIDMQRKHTTVLRIENIHYLSKDTFIQQGCSQFNKNKKTWNNREKNMVSSFHINQKSA